jgi:hypothetical protein
VQLCDLQGADHSLWLPLECPPCIECSTHVSHSTIWQRAVQIYAQLVAIHLDGCEWTVKACIRDKGESSLLSFFSTKPCISCKVKGKPALAQLWFLPPHYRILTQGQKTHCCPLTWHQRTPKQEPEA